jgi:hypothetical protein
MEEYDLDDLLEKLSDDPCEFNLQLAFKCLLKEVMHLRTYIYYLHELIPMKFRKVSPGFNENPFFSLHDIKGNPKLYEEAKQRMALFLEIPRTDEKQS